VVINGNVATAADEADVNVVVSVTDVRKLDLSDYTGQLELRPTVEITDRNNGPAEVGEGEPFDLSIPVPCSTTGAAGMPNAVGSTCSVTTSVDAVYPSPGNLAVRESRRSNWEMSDVRVYDGGPDGLASSRTGNTLFATQGVFVP